MMAKVIDVVGKLQEMVGSGYEVSCTDTCHCNLSSDEVAFTIRPIEEECNAAPVIYLAMSDIVRGGATKLAEKIMYEYGEARMEESGRITLDDLSKAFVLKNVIYRLINQKANKKLLKGCPHRLFCDMALVYYVKVSADPWCYKSFRILNEHLKIFELSQDELEEAAVRNMYDEGISFIDLVDLEKDMSALRKSGRKREAIDLLTGLHVPAKYNVAIESADIRGDQMYMLTNHRQLNGAAVMALPGMLNRIADQADGDIVIYPGSIHEVYVQKLTPNVLRRKCNKLVRDANRHMVAPGDTLSNHAYIYRRDQKKLVRF